MDSSNDSAEGACEREARDPSLGERAGDALRRLSPSERENLLVKCWMSHDARWFMAVAQEYGIEAACRLNQVAAREVGKAEARRLARALELPPVTTVEDYLIFQEALIRVLGPFLLDYTLHEDGENAFRIDVRRCFAHDNAVRAGIAARYDCGIFARLRGWLDAADLEHVIDPALVGCLMAQGKPCSHRIAIDGQAAEQRE